MCCQQDKRKQQSASAWQVLISDTHTHTITQSVCAIHLVAPASHPAESSQANSTVLTCITVLLCGHSRVRPLLWLQSRVPDNYLDQLIRGLGDEMTPAPDILVCFGMWVLVPCQSRQTTCKQLHILAINHKNVIQSAWMWLYFLFGNYYCYSLSSLYSCDFM